MTYLTTLPLFAQQKQQQYKPNTPYKTTSPPPPPKPGELAIDTVTYILSGVGAVLVFGAVFWYARKQWIKLRPKLDAKSGAAAERERPGFLAENLAAERWDRSVEITLKGVESALLADGSPISAKAAAALREVTPLPAAVAAITRQAATAAVESGELQSRLLSTTPTAVYALVCPARHAHVRLLRKHPAFADGWLEYAAQLRRGLGRKGSPPDVLCLLFFIGPDARDGTLAVAYESADGRLATAELVDGDASGDERPLRRVSGWGFQLAAPSDERGN